MEIEYHSDGIPEKFLARLKTGQQGPCFRRRAVLADAAGRWELVCCTVEQMTPTVAEIVPTPTRRYARAVLHEDLLTEEECLRFVGDLHAGGGRIGDCQIETRNNPRWETRHLPVTNEFMSGAGLVVGIGVGQRNGRPLIQTLLAPDQPYYPDLDEAARDWLSFVTYHGHNDARNDQVFFLLPETRAFFCGAEFVETGLLAVKVAGAKVNAVELLVKGAYWKHGAIHHFECAVTDSMANVPVPEDADRLEYYLIDGVGTAFDFHREDRFWQTQTGSPVLGPSKKSLEAQARKALLAGEGLKIEFKPFLAPDLKRPNGGKSKFVEIVTTAVAFANAEGGDIYFGVSDDCTVSSIDGNIREWVEGPCDEEAIERYLSAVKSRIKTAVDGELVLEAAHLSLDGALIAVLHVRAADKKPIVISQDRHLYVRTGASNRTVPPDQWKAVLGSPDGKMRA